MVGKQFERVPCLLCGEDNTEVVGRMGQHGIPATTVICKNDGLVYLNPRWTKERYAEFYATEYDKYYRSNELKSESIYFQRNRIKYTWNRIRKYTFKSALDIGAGSGVALGLLKVVGGMSLAGIEATDAGVEKLKSMGVAILAKDIDENWHTNNKNRFDLILMSHVLEHFLNPINVLKKVRHVLSPNGMVQITVPNMMCPTAGLEWERFRAVHTYYFSQATLEYAAALAGLKLLDKAKSSGSSLWCLFTRAEEDYQYQFESMYEQQKQLIVHCKKIGTLKEISLDKSQKGFVCVKFLSKKR